LFLIGLYFLKCTKFDQLILRKIIKIVATICQYFNAKMHQSLDLRGPTSKGRGRDRKGGGEGRKGEGRGGKGRREGRGAGKGEALRHFSFYNLTTDLN